MRLLHLHIIEAPSCGGLLDGLMVNLHRSQTWGDGQLQPLCLIGPNGSGKSQFLQVIAEIFQAAWHTHNPQEERAEANPRLRFSILYEIAPIQRGRSEADLSRDKSGCLEKRQEGKGKM